MILYPSSSKKNISRSVKEALFYNFNSNGCILSEKILLLNLNYGLFFGPGVSEEDVKIIYGLK